MFGNNFSPEQKIPAAVEQGPEEIYETKESSLMKNLSGFLENLSFEQLKTKAARALTAFSLVMGASSAFAQESKEQPLVPPAQSQAVNNETPDSENIDGAAILELQKVEEKKQEKNEVAPFDWRSMVKKFEISAGTDIETPKFFSPQVVQRFVYGYGNMDGSSFYRGMSEKSYFDAEIAYGNGINLSPDANSFFSSLSSQQEKLNSQQKVLLLQESGMRLLNGYDYDMFSRNEHVSIDSNRMFNGIKGQYQTGQVEKLGMCGNIHTFLTEQAEALGLPAWLQSGRTKTANHVWTGLITEVNGKKQIGFLNYNEFIPAGTLDYRDALGVWERYQSAIGTFDSYVGNEKKVLFPVKSRAQETIEHAAGIEDGTKRLDSHIGAGKIEAAENGLAVTLSPEITELKLNTDSFALSVFHFTDLKNNPYQSLEALTALSGEYHHKGKNLGFEIGTTILHLNTKDLHGGSEATNEIIARLAAEYIKEKQLTVGDYGKFLLDFGATFEAAARLPLNKSLFPLLPGTENALSKLPGGSKIDLSVGTAESHFSTANRLVYLDPNHIGKFYVGASQDFRVQIDDFQQQNFVLKKVADNFNIGAELKVHEGTILNLEAQKSNLDWGNSLSVKGGVTSEKLKGEISYKKSDSKYEMLVPSSTTLEATVGYQGDTDQKGPKWRMDIYGAQTTNRYQHAEKTNTYNVGIKFTIYGW